LDEEADMVGELGGGIGDFENSKKDNFFEVDERKMRHTSANVTIGTELFKGLDEIKKASEDPFNDLDERLK
jgi:hypothetical protein